MSPLADDASRAAWLSAMRDGQRFQGYVEWKQRAKDWVRTELDGITTADVLVTMLNHVEAGGRLDQVPETREEWSEFEYHFDVRVQIAGRRLYVETVLVRSDPDDPLVQIVNIHDA